MKYYPLTLNALSFVFVKILALSDDRIVRFVQAMNVCEEMKTWHATTKTTRVHVDANPEDAVSIGCTRRELARFFGSVLSLSKPVRGMFVSDFDRLLKTLAMRGFWDVESVSKKPNSGIEASL